MTKREFRNLVKEIKHNTKDYLKFKFALKNLEESYKTVNKDIPIIKSFIETNNIDSIKSWYPRYYELIKT